MSDLDLREVEGGVTLRARAKPRASKSRVTGVREGLLEIAVAAPPVDGEANDELVRTVARYFGVPRRAVTVEAGGASRVKRLRIEGLSPAEVRARVGLPPG
jgi:hypothetical protein